MDSRTISMKTHRLASTWLALTLLLSGCTSAPGDEVAQGENAIGSDQAETYLTLREVTLANGPEGAFLRSDEVIVTYFKIFVNGKEQHPVGFPLANRPTSWLLLSAGTVILHNLTFTVDSSSAKVVIEVWAERPRAPDQQLAALAYELAASSMGEQVASDKGTSLVLDVHR